MDEDQHRNWVPQRLFRIAKGRYLCLCTYGSDPLVTNEYRIFIGTAAKMNEVAINKVKKTGTGIYRQLIFTTSEGNLSIPLMQTPLSATWDNDNVVGSALMELELNDYPIQIVDNYLKIR